MATIQETSRDAGNIARVISILLGVWLFISAFIWPHTTELMYDSWICGALAVIFGAVAMRIPQARYLNTLLAVWVFITAFAFPSISVGTIWNNVLVSVALFISSLVPSGHVAHPPLTPRPA